MDCTKAMELINQAALSDPKEQELNELQHHLNTCPACLKKYQKAKKAVELVGAIGHVTIPALLKEKIISHGKRQLDSIRFKRRMWQVTFAIAAMLMLAFAGWMFFHADQTKPAELCECWRFVGHDPGNSRATPLSCLPSELLWRQKLDGLEGAYKPLAWKDLVIVSRVSNQNKKGCHLLAFDANSGEIRWQREFASGDFYKAKLFPDRCIIKGRLYITDGSQCQVLDIENGHTVKQLKPPTSCMGWGYLTADQDYLFGADLNGTCVFSIHAPSSKTHWEYAMNGSVFMPALSQGRILIHSDNGKLVALNAKTGKEIWVKEDLDLKCKSGLHLRGKQAVLLSQCDEIVALNAANGKITWSKHVPGVFASGIALGETAIYIMGGTQALGLANGQTVWKEDSKIHGICSAPTLFKDHLLATAGSQAGNLNVLSLSGEVVGRVRDMAYQACEGAIVLKGLVYMTAGSHLLAFSCSKKG